jgi:REP element-mobilizing transposase RayT
VFTHCVWAAPAYFRDDVDRMVFLRELGRATAKFDWKCIAHCLLDTHAHLVLGVEDGALARGMQSLNWRYAIQFNQRHKLRGHVQFERYGARRIEGDSDLLTTFRYVARNPVEAKLCTTPQTWPWSSYAGTVGLLEPNSFVDARQVLDCFECSPERAVARLRDFVETPLDDLVTVPGTGRVGTSHVQLANGSNFSYIPER